MIQLDSLRSSVPAIFAEKPSSKVSEKYQFVPTVQVLEILQNEGWNIMSAKQQKSKESKGETKHTVMLRRNADIQVTQRYPTLRVINSHDWSSRFLVLFGMFELLCSNGLFFAGPDFESYNVRHDQISEDILSILARFNSAETRMRELAEAWERIHLSQEQIGCFAMEAARIRFGENANSEIASRMAFPRFARQSADDLWSVYNTIQGNAINGGFRAGRRAARRITNIEAEKKVNEAIFTLARTFES